MEEALRGKRSWVTSRGWLLIWDPATLATFLWDPRAANKIALPQWASPPAAGTDCALSGDPTGPADCFTLVVLEPFESESDDTALWYCHAGGTSPPSPWTRHVYDLGGSWLSAPWGKFWTKRFVSSLTACRGKFYWPASADKYGVLEFSPEASLTTLPMAKTGDVTVPPGAAYARAFKYSLDLNGEVHVAWIFFTGHEAEAVVNIGIYRVDLAGKRFVRVDSIGDRAILAGGSSWPFAGWCPATEFGLLPNSVYWMHPYQSRMYVYDVGSNTEEVRELGEGVREPSRPPFWIVPAHH
uniref:KIB1-4 beta-propeller domain-containing protein n=1 Tax=Aegilops tauschii TaxID=37682 RepID=N1QX72_AEGTA